MNLTIEELKSLLDYNPNTGQFFWKVKRWRRRPGDEAGYRRADGYWYIKINQVKYGRHVLAWFYTYGTWPLYFIDHKDRTPGHDWIENLRDVTQSINMNNVSVKRKTRDGYRGVGFHHTTQKWIAVKYVKGKPTYLGKYLEEEVAAATVMQMNYDLFGSFEGVA